MLSPSQAQDTFPGAVTLGVFCFERSSDVPRPIGVPRNGGLGVVSMASCEASSAGLGWLVAAACLSAGTGTAVPARGLALASRGAGAALDASFVACAVALATGTEGAWGVPWGLTGRVPRGTRTECSAAPRRATSAKLVCVRNSLCRASLKVMFSLYFRAIISFSFFHCGHKREYAACSPMQFTQWSGASQVSDEWSGRLHFGHAALPRQLNEPWPNLWHL